MERGSYAPNRRADQEHDPRSRPRLIRYRREAHAAPAQSPLPWPGVTPSLALTAHAEYDVTILRDVGGQGFGEPTPYTHPGRALEGPIQRAVPRRCSGRRRKATDVGGPPGVRLATPKLWGSTIRAPLLGYGEHEGGTKGFLLTPLATAVREPSTWAMLLVGFAGLGFASGCSAKKGPATLAA